MGLDSLVGLVGLVGVVGLVGLDDLVVRMVCRYGWFVGSGLGLVYGRLRIICLMRFQFRGTCVCRTLKL